MHRFGTDLVSADPTTKTFFKPGKRDGKFQFDLTAYIAARLEQAKITQISVSGRDTYSEEACFFSYRRSVHKGEPDYGRALSMIALAPKDSRGQIFDMPHMIILILFSFVVLLFSCAV